MYTVTKVIANDDFTLELEFSNGERRLFDTTPYLDKGIFIELQDLDYFKKVRVALGTVQWPNEQDFGPATLYLESMIVEAVAKP
jgi:hypothetical protein